MPTAAQEVMIAKYQPQIVGKKAKPPATCRRVTTCASSAAVLTWGTAKFAAARKAKKKVRPKKVMTKKTLTRKVAMKKTKHTSVMVTAWNPCDAAHGAPAELSSLAKAASVL